MNVEKAISSRRSIRKFSRKEISSGCMRRIIQAGIDAPSAKNRQPWKFTVVSGRQKNEMIQCLRKGIEREGKTHEVLPGCVQYIAGAKQTVDCMEQAPVTVFIENRLNKKQTSFTEEEKFFETANVQSVGAAIQNMLLAAQSMGIGSLWICDIYFAYSEICAWLETDNQVIAAVSFGYPDEKPEKRPRMSIDECTQWKQ
jgi:nitroreductase